jgi:FAD/FMN-containing dehydrogenase
MTGSIVAQPAARLGEAFTGDAIQPGDPAYDDARRVFNGLVDKRPALIARCRRTADVVRAIAVARDLGLEIAVRGGGHNIAGRSTTDGGVVVDLSPMNEIVVDPGSRTATVGGGATWREFNDAAFEHRLATTGGTISTTGVAGLTLGGGLGWLMSSHGLAADNVRGVELVTAAGDILRVDAEHHPELFWAVRGGGGNFGVVTSFDFRLHPIGEITGGLIAHPFAAAGDFLRFVREFAASASDATGLMPLLVHAPDGSGMPLAAVAVFHGGSAEEARTELAPLVGFGSPILSQVGPMPYPAINRMLDDGFPAGSLYYWKSSFLSSLSDDAIDVLVRRFPDCPSPFTGVAIEYFHGAVTRVPVDATAVPHRAPGWNLLIASGWTDPSTTDANIAWTRETYAALAPHFVDRHYANYVSADEVRVRAAYGPNYDRLAQVKRRYDPDNVFRLNHNIPPEAT